MISGCSTARSPAFVASTDVDETPLRLGDPVPFNGVLLSYGRYEYLLRCENYVEQEGAMP
jgi:hypothetical protein